jgi:hypothetical protein
MFEPADENNKQEEAMYDESNVAYGLLMYAYDRLPYVTTTQTDIATDDAVTNQTGTSYWNMANGSWDASNNPMTQWDACKDGIQYANLFLTKVDQVKWALSAASKQRMFIDRMKGEAFGLRAILYYHLLQAHAGYADDGVLYGVPLLTAPENGGSDFNQPRARFSDCVKQCFADCDSALALLPAVYKNITSESEIPQKYLQLGAQVSGYNLVFGANKVGLISGNVVGAVKAQIALLATSPAFKEQSGVSAEEAALICANALSSINGLEGFDPVGNTWYKPNDPNDPKYDNLKPSAAEKPEILWRENRSNDNRQEKENFPPSLFGNGRVNPSQNLVDAFPMANGYPITDANSGYDANNPYVGRDPRLANTVIYHDMEFKGSQIKTGSHIPYGASGKETDDNLNDGSQSTRTGYYLCKLLRSDVSTSPSAPTNQYHLYPRIRYTEIFLAFAETANEAWGPKSDPKGTGMTAYSVIKAIRERGGLPAEDGYLESCATDQTKMRELIRNERRIELCFENKRFWDLRRWMLPLDETVMGMKVELDPTKTDGTLIYTRIEVENRVFDNSYQCYGPLPKGELLKWDNLKQNKGWQ